MLGKSRDEEKQGRKKWFWVLGSGSLVLGKAKAEERVLGSGSLVLGKAGAEEKALFPRTQQPRNQDRFSRS
ncbi:hypothetical protein EA24_08555 [Vibrio navarrensis]|nr:hypothetical protein EA24_08555 [Vibrio navarrensis]